MIGIKVKEFNKLYTIKSIDHILILMYISWLLKKRKDLNLMRGMYWSVLFKNPYLPLIMDNNMSHIAEECIRFTKNDIITEMVEDFIGKSNIRYLTSKYFICLYVHISIELLSIKIMITQR